MSAILSIGEYVLVVLSLVLLLAPVGAYLRNGWAARRREILGVFHREHVVRQYLEKFFPAELDGARDLRRTFAQHYGRRFSRTQYLLPAVVLTLVAGFLLILVGVAVFQTLRGEEEPKLALPPVVMAAIAGAGMWVLHDLITRSRCLDLRPVDLFWASFRLAIAGPLGLALAGLFTQAVGMAVALAIGAFPTRTLMTLLRRVAVSSFKLGAAGKESVPELEALQGIGRAEAERFEDEGVATILQLAYADPVDLTIRTNFSFSYVVDCCSQALAWLYFEGDLVKLRRFGLRGGQEISTLIDELGNGDSDKPEDKNAAKRARNTLRLAAKAIDMDLGPLALERCFREVAEDPYVCFLCGVWQTPEEKKAKKRDC